MYGGPTTVKTFQCRRMTIPCTARNGDFHVKNDIYIYGTHFGREKTLKNVDSQIKRTGGAQCTACIGWIKVRNLESILSFLE